MRLNHALLRAAAVPVLALVSSCGGGGGDSQPPPVTVPSTPAPTPSPTPLPPSGAARFLVMAAGPMPAQVRIDSNNNGVFGDAGDALTTTTYAGEFGQGIAPGQPAQSVGTVPATPLYRMEATGLDSVSGFVYSGMRAPAGATILSPLTTLILAQGSEAAVRSALGLASGTDGLAASTSLLTFDPVAGLRSTDPAVARDAARITSLNVQLMALAAVAKDTNGDPVDMNVSMVEGSRYLAELINAAGSVRLSDKNLLIEILKKSRYQFGTTAEQLDAMAALLARYFALVPARLADDQSARAWAMAFRFHVLADMRTLASQWPNPALARIAATSDADILSSVQHYRSAPAPVLGEFVAVPDYRELTASSATPYFSMSTGCASEPRHPTCNDYQMFAGVGNGNVVTSVVAGEPNTIDLVLGPSGSSVTIRRVGSYVGTTYFTYTARSPSGDTATGRVYVRVLGGA